MNNPSRPRFVVTKDGKPFRAYQELAIAMLVVDLFLDLRPSHEWGVRLEKTVYA